jgi:hypothetical protein
MLLVETMLINKQKKTGKPETVDRVGNFFLNRQICFG